MVPGACVKTVEVAAVTRAERTLTLRMSALVFLSAVIIAVYEPAPPELLSVQAGTAAMPVSAWTITIKSLTAGVAVTVCVPEVVLKEVPRSCTRAGAIAVSLKVNKAVKLEPLLSVSDQVAACEPPPLIICSSIALLKPLKSVAC